MDHQTHLEMGIKSERMIQAHIADYAVYLPERLVTNQEIEDQIHVDGVPFGKNVLQKLFGSRERYFADDVTQVSDLAARAGAQILSRTKVKVDLLIFAAASSDLIEPATSNIVQQKLGLHCPVMDIKNACNSVTTAMDTASAFIACGRYQNVLIVNGEKLSEVINFNPTNEEHLMSCIPGYSLGDAGAAVLISAHGGSPIHFQHAATWGEYWPLCTVAGGGSQSFRNQASYYFEGKTAGMRDVFNDKGLTYALQILKEQNWHIDDIDCLITHQVSKASVDDVSRTMGIPVEKCINIFELYGNVAAASIPLAIDHAVKNKKLKKGDRLLIVGLAAGISVSIQLITW